MLVPSTSVLPPGVAAALFWASVLACLVAQLFIIRAALRAEIPPAPGAQVPAPRRGAEVAWAVLPVVALVAVWLGAWRALPN
jgi:hypothetical protein